MSERQKIKNAERLANDVKAEAYQTRSILEQTAAHLQAVASKIFLGDRQMANQVTAMITQDFILLSEDITDDTNIISSLDHKTALRKKLLEHRAYLNERLIEINDLQTQILDMMIAVNKIRSVANMETAKFNQEFDVELKRLSKSSDFKPFTQAKKVTRLLNDPTFIDGINATSKKQLQQSKIQKRAADKLTKHIEILQKQSHQTRHIIDTTLKNIK
jgi:hypothetical protein